MSDAAEPLPEPDSTAATPRQLAMLDRLAEAGLQIAIALETCAKAAAAAPADKPVDLDAVALGYSRVARAVRLSILLQSKLIEDKDKGDRAAVRQRGTEERIAQAAAATVKAQADEEARRLDPLYVRQMRIERIVERVAEREHGDDEERVDRLIAEAGERLDDEDLYGDILQRPLGEMVALICRDLGLNPDWERLAGEAWALEERATGDRRSPFSTSPSPIKGEGRRQASYFFPAAFGTLNTQSVVPPAGLSISGLSAAQVMSCGPPPPETTATYSWPPTV
jgi:hypothetical protein